MLYRLYASCIPVKGYKRGLICDLQRKEYILVPLSLIELFSPFGLLDLAEIYSKTTQEEKTIVDSYLNLLLQKELIFETDLKDDKNFPPLSLEWDFPSIITNMIIDVPASAKFDYENLLKVQARSVKCRYLQIRCFHDTDMKFWYDLMAIVNTTPIRTVDIITKDSPGCFTHGDIVDFVSHNRKVLAVTLHSSADNKVIKQPEYGFGIVICVCEEITSEAHCGIINHINFTPNIETFTESLKYNSCLNRKLSIDTNGNIKNCPSMSKSYGNVNDTSFIEAIEKAGFKDMWKITKDEIKVCRDCEFRYICTDCRAYIEEPDDLYSKPLKCGYDPYTCTWSDWSNNPLKTKAVAYYTNLKQ